MAIMAFESEIFIGQGENPISCILILCNSVDFNIILICSHISFGDLLMNLSDFKRNNTILKSSRRLICSFYVTFVQNIPGQNCFSADILIADF